MTTPFDVEKLDELMDADGVDLILASSKHNVQYALQGYRFLFFAHMDAFGTSRYLPFLGYPRGRPEDSFYVANVYEGWQQEADGRPLWVGEVRNCSWGSVSAAIEAADIIRRRGLAAGTIAVERSWLPADAADVLTRELPRATFVEATSILEELRAEKRPEELALLRSASERIVEAMTAVVHAARPGMTKLELAARLQLEQVERGLDFDYCLLTVGQGLNRSPSRESLPERGILSLDSGGNQQGYIGDVTRMGVLGEPTAAQREWLAEVLAVQDAARSRVRPGALGQEIFEAAREAMAECPHGSEMVFLAHGMGLVHTESPRLTANPAMPNPPHYAERPLRPHMVISVETHFGTPDTGFIKLEDTIAVTESGYEAYGDTSREWITGHGG